MCLPNNYGWDNVGLYLLEAPSTYLKQLEPLIIKITIIRHISLAKQVRLAAPTAAVLSHWSAFGFLRHRVLSCLVQLMHEESSEGWLNLIAGPQFNTAAHLHSPKGTIMFSLL